MPDKFQHWISMIEPFPPEHYCLLWRWLREFPEQNFDDAGPKTLEELEQSIKERYRAGHTLIEVLANEKPAGLIGYQQVSLDVGIFRGICFTQSVHGSGIPIQALREFLESLFDGQTEKVYAQYFSFNRRVGRFLQKLGATLCGEALISMSKQHGEPLSYTEVVISHESFLCSIARLGTGQTNPDRQEALLCPALR